MNPINHSPGKVDGFGGMHGFGRHGKFGFRTSFDYDAFVADALGVSVAELQAARQAAEEAALEQAVAEGVITEEQAELMKARKFSLLRLALMWQI
jgi:hypothetical protein